MPAGFGKGRSAAADRCRQPASRISHVLRPGGLVNNINANGEAFRVPAACAELEGQDVAATPKPAVRLA